VDSSGNEILKLFMSSLEGGPGGTPETPGMTGLKKLISDFFDFQFDPAFAIDIQGKVIIWNKAMADFTGLSASAILGKGDFEYAVPFHRSRRPMLIDYMLTREDVILEPYHHVKKEGEEVLAEFEVMRIPHEPSALLMKARAIYGSDGEVIGAIQTIKDISAHKHTRNELDEVEARYRALFDRSLFCVYIHDFEGNYIDANKATLDTLGFTLEELKKLKFRSLVTEDQYPLAVRALEEILKNGYQTKIGRAHV
jgi:PAS domain S-box-containing protein